MNSKCRYNRFAYSKGEIETLVKCQRLLDMHRKYTSCVSGKNFNSEFTWKNDIIRHLDTESSNYFFYLMLSDVPKCKWCNKTLGLKQYSYGARSLGFKGFKKYCEECEKNQVWKKHTRSDTERKNISKGLKKWAKTDDGKKYYKLVGERNKLFMLKFAKTSEGKTIREQSKNKQSKSIREKIKNGSFTPNITNSWTHWNTEVKIDNVIKKYRSSWEACFAICHPTYKYEFLRIPYGNGKIYIGDFYDDVNRILYEIKPTRTYNTQIDKITSSIEWCRSNQIKFVWINERNIMDYIDHEKITGCNYKHYEKMLKGIKYV